MAFLKHIWNRWQNLLHDEKLKHKIYVIIFESDTPMGKLFDVALIGFIVLSILVVVARVSRVGMLLSGLICECRSMFLLSSLRWSMC